MKRASFLYVFLLILSKRKGEVKSYCLQKWSKEKKKKRRKEGKEKSDGDKDGITRRKEFEERRKVNINI